LCVRVRARLHTASTHEFVACSLPLSFVFFVYFVVQSFLY